MIEILAAFCVFVIGFLFGFFIAKKKYNVRIVITRIRR